MCVCEGVSGWEGGCECVGVRVWVWGGLVCM